MVHPTMTSARLLRASALSLLLAACARGPAPVTGPVPAPAPSNPSAGTTRPQGANPRPAARTEAPANWHRLDLEQDGVLGVGSERALRELLANRRPQRRVVVAVIDGGVDTAHTLLRNNLWQNRSETPGNSRDDDNNGFVDDARGWNFAGGKNESVNHDTFELTRLYSACKGLPAGSGTPKPEPARCTELATDYGRKRVEITSTLEQVKNLTTALERTSATLREAMRTQDLTAANVRAYKPSTASVAEAQRMWLQLAENGLDAKELAEAQKAYDSQFRFALDTMYNPRNVVGDQSAPLPRGYGNRDVTGPDPLHGTHVAGIIGARRDQGGDVMGIAPDVMIMSVRAVPDGDERDTDVANAIRYAADNGANIINMSFGKGYSPRKASVDSAVRYAESKGVLMVHAAGNDGENTDVVPSYPSPLLADGQTLRNWIEVGASSWKGGSEIAANFSNYGKRSVDLFAPGVEILSSLPDGKTGKESGTSMAAPVVSGVAALLMSYFPNVTAADVKEVLLESSRKLGDVDVSGPGESGRLKFSALSRTGGVIDAYAAVKLLLDRERPRQP